MDIEIPGIYKLGCDPVIRAVFEECEALGREAWLVGGALRNLFLGAPSVLDYDFAVLDTALPVAEKVAERLNGTAFVMDRETGASRVAFKGGLSTIDISPLKGDISGDLKKRDFTVNALAADLSGIVSGNPLIIDPWGGVGDCRNRLIRAVSGSAFDDDPLRCLRAVRLSMQYGLVIEPGTLKLLSEKSNLLSLSSAERVRDELLMLFAAKGTADAVRLIYDTGMISAIFPEAAGWSDIGHYDLLAHSLKVLKETEEIISNVSEDTFPGLSCRIRERLQTATGGVSNAAVLKLAAFLHDAGKPATLSREEGRLRFTGHDREGAARVKEMLLGLKFSRKISLTVANLVKNHHRTFMLASLKDRTRRSKGHFFRASGGVAGVDLLLLAMADARATRGGEDEALYALVKEMAAFYYETYSVKKSAPLMDGEDIMRTFGIPEGRLVGEAMRRISEGIESGAIKERKDAVKLVKNWLATLDK